MGIYNSHGSPNGSPKKNCGRPSVSDYSQWMFVSWIVSLIISLPLFLFRILHVYTCMNICLSNLLLFWSCWGNGNGTPLQYSCLENPMDGRAWKAAVHGGHWGSDTTERLHFHFSLSCIGEGNGNPLQCSCLENPRDVGAWWAPIHGVAQNRTRLKWFSSSSIYLTVEKKNAKKDEIIHKNCKVEKRKKKKKNT